MSKKLTTNEIVKRFIEINGNKYDYSEFNYINAHTKGKIICPIHGEFWQSSNVHLKGTQCPQCAKEKIKRCGYKLTIENFLERANQIHNNKYEYNLTDYKNTKSKINIKCPIHNWFTQSVANHLCGQGCPKCANQVKHNMLVTQLNEFIDKANQVHNNKYDYSKVEYYNNKDYITIICPIHNEFIQRVDMHLKGQGCPKCVGKNQTKEEFIKRAKEIHKDMYDYSKVEYVNAETKICIKCNKCGKEFWQKSWSHLQKHGCPYCKFSKAELEIEDLLLSHNIDYIPQIKFNWLGRLSLDFFLPKYNIAIECQGKQHFLGNRCFGDIKQQEKIFERDKKKFDLCCNHNIKLLYYTNINSNKIPQNYYSKIYTNKEDLLNEIVNK